MAHAGTKNRLVDIDFAWLSNNVQVVSVLSKLRRALVQFRVVDVNGFVLVSPASISPGLTVFKPYAHATYPHSQSKALKALRIYVETLRVFGESFPNVDPNRALGIHLALLKANSRSFAQPASNALVEVLMGHQMFVRMAVALGKEYGFTDADFAEFGIPQISVAKAREYAASRRAR